MTLAKVVSKANIIGGMVMLYLPLRNIREEYFLHETVLLRAIIFLFFSLYFISGFIMLIKKIKFVSGKTWMLFLLR